MLKLNVIFISIQEVLNLLSRKRRLEILFCVLLSIIAGFFEIFTIALIIPFINGIANDGFQSNFLIELERKLNIFNGNFFTLLAICFIFTLLISMLIRIYTLKLQFKLSTNIASELGLMVLQKSYRMPYEWHMRTNSSILLGYLTKDVDNLSEYLRGLIKIQINIIIAISIGAYLIYLYPYKTILLFFIVSLFYIFIFLSLKVGMKRDGKIYSDSYQETLGTATEILNNIDIIKIVKNFDFFRKKFKGSNYKYRKHYANIIFKSEVPKFIIEGFILILTVALTTFVYLTKNSIQEELTFITTIGLGTYKMTIPIQQCFIGLSYVQSYKPSFKKVIDLCNLNINENFEVEPQLIRKNKNIEKDNLLEFSNVSFKYQSNKEYALKNINFVLGNKQKLGVVGTSGSGKSTFIKLLVGLLSPQKGEIIHGGKFSLANDINLDNWQKSLSYVSQETYLSDEDLISNIGYGLDKEFIDFKKVKKASKLSLVNEFVDNLPDKFKTNLGEKGAKLSGGQRQRIGIARSLYPVHSLLVLDEATSALDANNELKVIDNIFKSYLDKTVVIISHRLRSLRKCDQILVFSNGEIVDAGSFDELRKGNDIFRSLLNNESL